MHSILISIAIASLLTLELLVAGTSAVSLGTLAIAVAVATAIIGVPHGGLDHKLGTGLLRLSGRRGLLLFLAAYLAVALFVVAGWYLLPAITIGSFLLLSAWHFGLEEDERQGDRAWWHWAGLVARGGMVVWVPAAFCGPQMVELLSMVLPASNNALPAAVIGTLAWFAPALAILVVVDLLGPTRATASTAIRVAAFFALFAMVHPLWSFGIYFCGWHSIRGLIHLRAQTGYPIAKLVWQLVPISVAAIALLLAGFLYWSSIDALTPSVVRTLFVGLSALAIPHLMLHVAIDMHDASSTSARPDVLASGFSSGVAS